MSFGAWMGNQIIIYSNNGILFRMKQNRAIKLQTDMEEL